MDKIAEIADVSRPAIYQYVGSKEEVVREVLTLFHNTTLAMPEVSMYKGDILDVITRTNRYYIDYFAKNAIFMERVREVHRDMPEIVAEKQRINREWAQRIIRSVNRNRSSPIDSRSLEIRVFALECMVDDVLRELFVIENPDAVPLSNDLDRVASELSKVWYNALYLP